MHIPVCLFVYLSIFQFFSTSTFLPCVRRKAGVRVYYVRGWCVYRVGCARVCVRVCATDLMATTEARLAEKVGLRVDGLEL